MDVNVEKNSGHDSDCAESLELLDTGLKNPGHGKTKKVLIKIK